MNYTTDNMSYPEYPVYRFGLENLGNTCFLNASLQVLARVRGISMWIKMKGYEKEAGWKDAPEHLKELMKQVQDVYDAILSHRAGMISPNGFYCWFRRAVDKEGMGWLMEGQNDSHECMMCLLDMLHKCVSSDIRGNADIAEHLKKEQSILVKKDQEGDLREKLDVASESSWYHSFAKEYNSKLTRMLHGQFMTVITCADTTEMSFRFDPYSSINLAVPETRPGVISIHDCLDKFFASEPMTGDSQWESPSVGKVDAVRGSRVWSLPDVLILSLKRFTMTGQKIRTQITYPLKGLDMTPYCSGPSRDGDSSSRLFDLVGVVIHVGAVHGGHYLAFVRNPGGTWLCFNDTHVSLMKPDDVRDNADAYTLVYQKSKKLVSDDAADKILMKEYIRKAEEEAKANGTDVDLEGEDEDEDDDGGREDFDESYI